MKINNNTDFKYSPNLRNNYNNRLERSPFFDMVSFSSQKSIEEDDQKNVNSNVSKAVEFAQKMTDLVFSKPVSIEDIEDIIYHYDLLGTRVYPMEEMKYFNIDDDTYKYSNAAFVCAMRGDYKPYNKKMFLNLPDNNDDKRKICFIRSASHEFTHLMQSKDNKEYNLLKKISGENFEEARIICDLSNEIFKYFDIVTKNKATDFASTNDDYTYNMMMPKFLDVSKKDILNSLNVSDEQEFKDKCTNDFNKVFEIAIKKYYPEIMADDKKLNELKSKVKQMLQIQSEKEKEAYTTECFITKQILKCNGGLNIDSIPIFYEMLEKALS